MLSTLITTSFAVEAEPLWYLKATTGISQMNDQAGQSVGVGTQDGTTDVALDTGFTPGLAVGYQWNKHWSTELAWEYRSNDSQTTLTDGTVYQDGNYASNVFALNAYYHFRSAEQWRPYLGAGLIYGQEVDVDLEQNGIEVASFSGSGDTGIQVMAGLTYELNDSWYLNGELRYGSLAGIDLAGENNTGQINDLDYSPWTVGLGLQYNF